MIHKSQVSYKIIEGIEMNEKNQDQKEEKQLKSEQKFIENIWEQIEEQISQIIERILNTKFIQGIKRGDLSVQQFNNFLYQDTIYMRNGYKLWQLASIDSKQDRQLSQLCFYYSQKQRRYQKQMLKIIQNNVTKYNPHSILSQYSDQINNQINKPVKLKQSNQQLYESNQQLYESQQKGVIKQLQQYIEYKEKCYKSSSYHYVLVINLICYKIYPMIIQHIMPQINQSNPFIQWIKKNSQSRTVPLLQNKINQYQQYYNKNQVQYQLKKFLLFQYNFFNAFKL